jgi:DMSO/TMAO reductase YedYZ molybdopterin-dependent catalytic subunit
LPRTDFLPSEEAADRRILSREPPNAEAPESAFEQLITPAESRFVRSHSAVPMLGGDHLVDVSGALAHPLGWSLDDLRSLPQTTQTVVTECAGNGRTSIRPAVGGEPWGDAAVSTAQWTGAPLRSLLERAGLRDTALEVVFTGADGGDYQRSLPRETALDPDTVVALEMNGEPIPPLFGGPVRLVVPGWYGMASVKWLARIEAIERNFSGYYQSERYMYGPGMPVSRIRIKSRFASLPRSVHAGKPARIGLLAWGGEGVARVEVHTGQRWEEARMLGPVLPHAWRRFELRWTPGKPGRYVLRCRATDVHGVSQPDAPSWNPIGYGANGVQSIEISVS